MRKLKLSSTDKSKFYIKIDHEDHTEVTREADRSEDSWDADDISHSHTINGFNITEENKNWDFILTADPKGKTLYLVYALYHTGDSFHYEDNVISFVSLQEAEEDAVVIAKAIETDYKAYKDNGRDFGYKPLEVRLPISGKTETICVGTWKGYFEGLGEVRIEAVTASKHRRFNSW